MNVVHQMCERGLVGCGDAERGRTGAEQNRKYRSL